MLAPLILHNTYLIYRYTIRPVAEVRIAVAVVIIYPCFKLLFYILINFNINITYLFNILYFLLKNIYFLSFKSSTYANFCCSSCNCCCGNDNLLFFKQVILYFKFLFVYLCF